VKPSASLRRRSSVCPLRGRGADARAFETRALHDQLADRVEEAIQPLRGTRTEVRGALSRVRSAAAGEGGWAGESRPPHHRRPGRPGLRDEGGALDRGGGRRRGCSARVGGEWGTRNPRSPARRRKPERGIGGGEKTSTPRASSSLAGALSDTECTSTMFWSIARSRQGALPSQERAQSSVELARSSWAIADDDRANGHAPHAAKRHDRPRGGQRASSAKMTSTRTRPDRPPSPRELAGRRARRLVRRLHGEAQKILETAAAAGPPPGLLRPVHITPISSNPERRPSSSAGRNGACVS